MFLPFHLARKAQKCAISRQVRHNRADSKQGRSQLTQELESRVVDLEIQITHQANTIDDLSQMVSRQWEMIDRLSRQVTLLQDTLVELEENIGPPGNEKPPHY